jgi:hypothetical protein
MNLKSKKLMLIALPVLVILFGTIFLPTCKSPASPDTEDVLTKYTLTVSVGEGVTGNPASGTTDYPDGESVSYSYSLNSGYTNLAVTLDGQQVSASGTITMNSNHTLNASAEVIPVTFTQADLTGTWGGTIGSLNITFAVDESGSIDYISGQCALIGTMTIDSSGEVTEDGFGLYTENFSNWGQASWTLQMSNDKTTMSGTLGALIWGSRSVSLTKQ